MSSPHAAAGLPVDRHGLPKEKVTLATLAEFTVDARDTAGRAGTARGNDAGHRRPPADHRVRPAGSPSRSGPTCSCGSPTGCTAGSAPASASSCRATATRRRGPHRPRPARSRRGRRAAGLDPAGQRHARRGRRARAQLRQRGVTLTSFEADRTTSSCSAPTSARRAPSSRRRTALPPRPLAFLRAAEGRLAQLTEDPALAARLAQKQHTRMQAFAALPRARDWTRSLYERWAS